MNEEKFTVRANQAGWPFWIVVSTFDTSLRLWEAKQLRLQLDEAIEFVERQEEIQHERALAVARKEILEPHK